VRPPVTIALMTVRDGGLISFFCSDAEGNEPTVISPLAMIDPQSRT
jgi:hypothetical protein